MDSMQRFFQEEDGPRIVGQTPINKPASSSPITTATVKPRPPLRSNSSNSSRAVSRGGSTSPSNPTVFSASPSSPSEASSAPSVVDDPLNEQLATMSISSQLPGYELPCILRGIIDCNDVFSGSMFQHWFLHSLAHYGDAGPPDHAMCIFCHSIFDSNTHLRTWRDRMQHIADHFEMGWTIEDSLPDFKVLEDMAKKGCLSWDAYNYFALGTERPQIDGLRPSDWKPEEVIEKELAEARIENRIVITESRRDLRDRRLRTTRTGRSRRVEVKNPTERPAE